MSQASCRPCWHHALAPLCRNLAAATTLFLATSACQPQPAPSDTTGTSAPQSATNAMKVTLPDNASTIPAATDFTGLKLLDDKTDALGMRHQHYQQYFQGLPVWPGDSTLHLNQHGEVIRASGEILQIPDSFGITPSINAERAVTVALAAVEGAWQSERSWLLIVNRDQTPVLAWEVDLSQGLKQRAVLIDANTGALINVIEKTWS